MTKRITVLVATACMAAFTSFAANYSTEATMTRQKYKGTYEVVVSVSRLLEHDGKTTEQLIDRPKITSAPGVPATLQCGMQPTDADYKKKENITVDVSWPQSGKQDFAVCTVVIKLGDKIVSKTKTRVTVDES
jgi:hypothetical protein